MRMPTPLSRAALCLTFLLAALPTLAAAQTATVRRTVLLHADSAVTSRGIERLDPGMRLSLLSTDHPNGYYNVRAPDDSVGWVYGRHILLDAVTSGSTSPIQPTESVPGSAQTVGCGDGLWAHVYNPHRLIVKAQCITVTGTLMDATNGHYSRGVRHEADGDTHGWIRLDPQYKNLLDAGNMVEEDSNLVFEIVCHWTPRSSADSARVACGTYRDSTVLPLVKLHRHVSITGTFVQDTRHGQWNEIHPVSKIDTIQH